MALAEKVLIFFALFQKLEPTEKICSPCITITSHDGIDDDLAGTYRYTYINMNEAFKNKDVCAICAIK